MSARKIYVLSEVTELLCVDQEFVIQCVESRWVSPASHEAIELDEVDLARLRLILDLKQDFGVNDEAIPVILHLIDQLYAIHGRMKLPSL